MTELSGTGRALRPHAKSHKCPAIAKAQLAAGAVGICCATLDEAEVMAAAGVRGILLTSPITVPQKLTRLVRLLATAPDLMVVVDHPDAARALAAAARSAGAACGVLIDIELGFGRTGVPDAAAAETLARTIAPEDGLVYRGIQAYGGQLQHIGDYPKRLAACRNAHRFISEIVERLTAIGSPPPIVSGGGTGSFTFDMKEGPFTEIQAGSYIFMDAEYEQVAFAEDAPAWPFKRSLFVQTSVISVNGQGFVTTDAGTKAFALNGPQPIITDPDLGESKYEYAGDEHGRLRLSPSTPKPRLGARVECLTSHCDPTVARYDYYNVVRGDRVIDTWSIAARGWR